MHTLPDSGIGFSLFLLPDGEKAPKLKQGAGGRKDRPFICSPGPGWGPFKPHEAEGFAEESKMSQGIRAEPGDQRPREPLAPGPHLAVRPCKGFHTRNPQLPCLHREMELAQGHALGTRWKCEDPRAAV